MLPRHYATHYLCAHTYIIKNITMKQRTQNKNLASSDKTTIVLFVIQLFLLFDKTVSCEPSVYRPEKSLQIYSLWHLDDG